MPSDVVVPKTAYSYCISFQLLTRLMSHISNISLVTGNSVLKNGSNPITIFQFLINVTSPIAIVFSTTIKMAKQLQLDFNIQQLN